MSVYNKELIIDGEAVLSPEQQVYKNAKDIKTLKQFIKESYHTSTALTSSSVSVATEDVEGLGEASSGWLLTDDGLLFKITANDGTTTLIQFFSDIKGPQGEDGAAVNIDDTGTSQTKVWSSDKTNNEIQALIDDTAESPTTSKTWSIQKIDSLLSNSLAWTTTSMSGGSISLSNVYFANSAASSMGIGNPKIKVKDVIAHKDGSGKVDSLYYVTAISSGTASVTKIGDIGGGKQLYQHYVDINNYHNTDQAYFTFTIKNGSNASLTYDDILEYLQTKGFTSTSHLLTASGTMYSSSDARIVMGIYVESLDATYWSVRGAKTGSSASMGKIDINKQDAVITDTVVAL